MQLPAKRRNYRFPRRSNGDLYWGSNNNGDCGYVLLLVMMMAAIVLISLTAALPSVYTQAQREKEKELIFRGTQYARAIYLFHQQFHRYPASVKELLRTNDMSFLRRPYPDPMSKDGKWRFIHATASGIILDSADITVKNPLKPGESSSGQEGSGNGSNSSQGQGQSQLGQGVPEAGEGSGSNLSQGQGQQQGQGFQTNSSPFSPGQMTGAYLVGVASSSRRASIRIYNDHKYYDKWEFLGIPGVPGSVVQLPVAIPGLTPEPQPGALSPASPAPAAPSTPTMNPTAGGPGTP